MRNLEKVLTIYDDRRQQAAGHRLGNVEVLQELDPVDHEPAQVGTYEVKGALPSEYYALAARRRSPDVNLLYYDPRVLYLPWMKADGTREPKASPEAAYYFYGHSTVTVNLRDTYRLRPNDHKVCVGAAWGWKV